MKRCQLTNDYCTPFPLYHTTTQVSKASRFIVILILNDNRGLGPVRLACRIHCVTSHGYDALFTALLARGH